MKSKCDKRLKRLDIQMILTPISLLLYSILEKLESKKRQVAVNKELFETEEALIDFKFEKTRQTLK